MCLNHPAIIFFIFPNSTDHCSNMNFAPIMKSTLVSNWSETRKSRRYVTLEPAGLKTMFRMIPLKVIRWPLRLPVEGALKSVNISASRPASTTHRLETASGICDPESSRQNPGIGGPLPEDRNSKRLLKGSYGMKCQFKAWKMGLWQYVVFQITKFGAITSIY